MNNNLKLIEKCWKIDTNRIEDGYLCDDDMFICYADTLNKAKYKLLEIAKENDLLNIFGDKFTYINIPVMRCNYYDKIEYNGEIISYNEFMREEERKNNNKMLDDILSNDDIELCHLKKNGYFYRNKSCGYTENFFDAGIYSKEEAVKHCKLCSDLELIPINVKEYNSNINNIITKKMEEIEILKSKYIFK